MRRPRIACALLALCLAAGCAAVPETEDAPVSQEIIPAQEEPAPPEPRLPESVTLEGLSLPEGAVALRTEVRYTLDRPVTVDGGRTLTLRLHCYTDTSGSGYWRYGVEEIDVLDGDQDIQFIHMREAIAEAHRRAGEEVSPWDLDRTFHFDPEDLLHIEDLNFDGAQDLRLAESVGSINATYLCFLWDPEAEQFVYAFSLRGYYDVTVDADARQLVAGARGDYGHYYTDYYAYDSAGALQRVKEVHISCDEEGGIHEVHELVDGQWVQTE